MCKKVSIFIYLFIFNDYQGKEHKMLKKVKCSLIFVSGKKAILSSERRACFDSEKSWECRPKSAFIF